MKKPITPMTTMASRAIIRKLASSAPKPKCEARAARPIPAARPARGPIHERLGWACGAAAGWLAGAGAVAWRGAWAGADCVLLVAIEWRCMPDELPPPRRLASASLMCRVKPSTRAAAIITKFFILCLLSVEIDRRSVTAVLNQNYQVYWLSYFGIFEVSSEQRSDGGRIGREVKVDIGSGQPVPPVDRD